jgi:hypothetical protein
MTGPHTMAVTSDLQRQLDELMRHGRELQASLETEPSSATTIAAIRSWQQACAGMVNHLSGGSKAHWLARAFSEAFLVRSVAGQAMGEASLIQIVGRLVDVLAQGIRSLAQVAETPDAGSGAAPKPRRFEFVHNAQLRPFLEQAYLNGRSALERGAHAEALITTCSALEAIITDALEHIGRNSHEWSYQTRIDTAERNGLIRGSCARLPPVALTYRDLIDGDGTLHPDIMVTARDARVTSQVLQVVMRDLSPGR